MTSAARPVGPYAPFRPRGTRVMCLILLVVTLVGAGLILRRLATLNSDTFTETISVIGVAVLAVLFLLRVATIRAIPDRAGLMVRNIILTDHLGWEQMVAVHLGERSWAQLDLADGTTLSVMAIQRSDGAYGRHEAQRLASLVAAHEGRETGGVDPSDTTGKE